MQKFKNSILPVALLGIATLVFSASSCKPDAPTTGGTATGGAAQPVTGTAATVNGKAIAMEEIEKLIKQNAQGQEAKLSPLELAQARLQVVDSLIKREVMFQKAEKEGSVPNDDEITQELNKNKTSSGMSAEEFDKKMKEIGMTEADLRDNLKKEIAIKKLSDKITAKVEPPKDSEIEAFYAGNKEIFVKKKGVKLAAIVIDPKNNGEGDVTVDDKSTQMRGQEIMNQLAQGADFATVAREKSEDPQSKTTGGDLGYFAQEDLNQSGMPEQAAQALMDARFPVGKTIVTQMQGKFYILKLQERSDKDENLTLESPGVRQQVADNLVNARKSLLTQVYMALAMDEAKIDNLLAKKIIENPNELSGARPAGSGDANANTANANANANTANANADKKDDKKADDKKADDKKEDKKPEANANAAASNANAAANAPANANK